jgi:hypothetical protein
MLAGAAGDPERQIAALERIERGVTEHESEHLR